MFSSNVVLNFQLYTLKIPYKVKVIKYKDDNDNYYYI